MADKYYDSVKKSDLKALVTGALEEEASRLATYLDAEADLAALVLEDAVQAAATGQEELSAEIRAQLRSIAARAERESAGAVIEGLTSVARVAISALRVAL